MSQDSSAESESTGARGLPVILERLSQTVEERKHYEALQQYKSLFFRYSARKKAEAGEVARTGATTLLLHGQGEAGLELALLFIKFLSDVDPEGSSQANIESVEAISGMFEFCINREESTTSSGCSEAQVAVPCGGRGRARKVKFLESALKWSRGSSRRDGHPRLHTLLGELYKVMGNKAKAYIHLVRGDRVEALVATVKEWADGPEPIGVPPAPSSQRDLFLARTVLMCLCAQKEEMAAAALQGLRDWATPPVGLEVDCEATPLVNFCVLLLKACPLKEARLLQVLKREYGPYLVRDPLFGEYLDSIGQLYFGMPAPRAGGMQGLLGALFNSSPS